MVRRPDPSVARAAKLATVSAGLTAILKPDSPAPAEPAASTGAAPTGKTAEPAPAATGLDPAAAASPTDDKTAKKPEAAPAAPKPDAKPEPVDDKTAKSIAAIDRRAAEVRKEQADARAKIEADRAEVARLRAEIDGRGTSDKELRELAKRDPAAALAKLGIESEDDWEIVGRSAYARTKAGKADPRAQPAVAQTAKERELQSKIADLEAKQDELATYLRTQTAQQTSQKFVNDYLDGAVKAIPATPTLIGKLHAKSPDKARAALLALGKTMEREAMAAEGTKKYSPDHTPDHADLVARYEKDRRAELEEQGVDVDALLASAKPAPTAAAAPAKSAPTTLDPVAPRGTQPINGNPTREQKLAAVSAGLKKLSAEQN